MKPGGNFIESTRKWSLDSSLTLSNFLARVRAEGTEGWLPGVLFMLNQDCNQDRLPALHCTQCVLAFYVS